MSGYPANLGTTQPAVDIVPVTPNDSTVFAMARAFWVGTAGDLAIRTASGNVRTIPNASGVIPVAGDKVMATNTTADGISAVY